MAENGDDATSASPPTVLCIMVRDDDWKEEQSVADNEQGVSEAIVQSSNELSSHSVLMLSLEHPVNETELPAFEETRER